MLYSSEKLYDIIQQKLGKSDFLFIGNDYTISFV